MQALSLTMHSGQFTNVGYGLLTQLFKIRLLFITAKKRFIDKLAYRFYIVDRLSGNEVCNTKLKNSTNDFSEYSS